MPPTTNGASDLPPSSSVLSVRSRNGDIPVKLLTQRGFRNHIHVLAETSGDGLWISEMTAGSAQVNPGGTIRLAYVERAGSRIVALRVKGIYRALDRETPDPSWANFLPQIIPEGADPPPPARFIFITEATFTDTVQALGGVPVTGIEEMAVEAAETGTTTLAATHEETASGTSSGCGSVTAPRARSTGCGLQPRSRAFPSPWRRAGISR